MFILLLIFFFYFLLFDPSGKKTFEFLYVPFPIFFISVIEKVFVPAKIFINKIKHLKENRCRISFYGVFFLLLFLTLTLLEMQQVTTSRVLNTVRLRTVGAVRSNRLLEEEAVLSACQVY